MVVVVGSPEVRGSKVQEHHGLGDWNQVISVVVDIKQVWNGKYHLSTQCPSNIFVRQVCDDFDLLFHSGHPPGKEGVTFFRGGGLRLTCFLCHHLKLFMKIKETSTMLCLSSLDRSHLKHSRQRPLSVCIYIENNYCHQIAQNTRCWA